MEGTRPAYATREDESWNLLTSPISLAIRRAGEKKMLQEFLGYLAQRRPSVLAGYSCTNFDRRVLGEAISRCGLDWRLFISVPHTDLGAELGRRFIFPMKRYTVKDVGRYFGYPFEHGDLDGFLVAFEYIQHLEEKRPLDKRVLEYNRDDVKVIEHIVHRLEKAGNL